MTSTMARATGVAAVEQAFGDPWDDTNPLGFAELLAADERQEMSPAGEAMLDQYGLNAEFVPAEHGGRFTRMDRFTRLMRAVWRHDACLGLGYGFSSFIAGANVWGAGDAAQRTRLADMLLSGRKVSSVYHELAHGNDFSHAEFAARPWGRGWLLNGRKEVVTNLVRSHAMVMFVRTDPRPGSRSHSQFLVSKEDIPDGAIRYLPRFLSSGMRGVQLGGAEFVDCPVRPDALIGASGRGIETALSSFQLTRTGLPALAAGCLDTGLRTALHCATERRLYGAGVIALPYVRAVLADAFTDLLIVDAFTTTVARALHLRPAETGVFASAVKAFGSRLLIDAMDELVTVLGARGYVRDGRYGIFQKMARDLPTAGFGHASRAACRVTVLPQLPRLARNAWLRGEPAAGLLFELDADLPPLPFERLVAGGPGTDCLTATLTDLAEQSLGGHLDRLVVPLVAEVGRLRDACGRLRPADLTIDASPAAAGLVDRYAAVLAAASCLGVWRHNRHDPFVGDDLWVTAALHRLTERLGLPPVLSEAQVVAAQEALLREALARLADRRAFDLTNHTLPG